MNLLLFGAISIIVLCIGALLLAIIIFTLAVWLIYKNKRNFILNPIYKVKNNFFSLSKELYTQTPLYVNKIRKYIDFENTDIDTLIISRNIGINSTDINICFKQFNNYYIALTNLQKILDININESTKDTNNQILDNCLLIIKTIKNYNKIICDYNNFISVFMGKIGKIFNKVFKIKTLNTFEIENY